MHYLWACGYTASFSRFSWVQTSRRIQSTSNYMQCLYIFFSSLYCDVVRRRPLSICMPLQNACTNIPIHSIFFSLSFAYSLHYTYLRVCQHTRVKQLKLNGDHRTTTSSNKTMLLYCLQCAPVGRTQSIQIRHRHWTAKTQILRCSMEFYGTRPGTDMWYLNYSPDTWPWTREKNVAVTKYELLLLFWDVSNSLDGIIVI